ncbi:hypothetical protein XaC1_286 [Xanthomonas phage XaC1]|nr:hypothetical protein XaC1_286 [Xanthomonas phage XaC1]
MIPHTDRTEIQTNVLNLIKSIHENDGISDRIILMNIFENYRTGGGLRLSSAGYDICIKNSLYIFYEVHLPRVKQTSMIFTSLDRICKTPYYALGNKIFLSDRMVFTHYTLCGDDFEKTFESFS